MKVQALSLGLALLAGPAFAEPLPPAPGPMVARLEVGVFCALQAMDQMPAPGTLSGWIHVVDGDIGFHWPDRQVVPAALGLAFGVKATLQPGSKAAFAQMRIYKPGLATPEVWENVFSDISPSLSFFRFDTPAELVPGVWRFEAWQADIQLYAVEFEVVPAAALPDIADACGAMS